jgi:transposase InsO family protein
MRTVSGQFRHVCHLVSVLLSLIIDAACYLGLCLRPSPRLAAENLFLRKQLALYQERQGKPRRATHATRIALVWLSRWFDWRRALGIVKPETFIGWHRQGFRLFWRWKSRPGRPTLPKDLQALMRRMALENPTWGRERIANELLLDLGLRVSPRTVRKYMPSHCVGGPGKRCPSQRWSTFICNQAQGIVACDFCVVVTATFRLLYVFVVIEHASRRLLHANVTSHPTAEWTLQQLREAIPSDHSYRLLIHDRGSSFSQDLDQHIQNLGLKILQTPPKSSQANAICERIIGTIRRECLDCIIPFTATHVRRLLVEWLTHDNGGGPHMSLGPGIPQPSVSVPIALHKHQHWLAPPLPVVSRPVLGGLHHEYRLDQQAA